MKVPARLPLILTFSRQGRRDFTNTLSVGGYGVQNAP